MSGLDVRVDLDRDGLYGLCDVLLHELVLGEVAPADEVRWAIWNQAIGDTMAACASEFIEVSR